AAARRGVDGELRRRRDGDVDRAAAGLDAVLAGEGAFDAHRAAARRDVDGAVHVARFDAAAARAQVHRAGGAVDVDAAAAGLDLDAAGEAARADAAAAGLDLELGVGGRGDLEVDRGVLEHAVVLVVELDADGVAVLLHLHVELARLIFGLGFALHVDVDRARGAGGELDAAGRAVEDDRGVRADLEVLRGGDERAAGGPTGSGAAGAGDDDGCCDGEGTHARLLRLLEKCRAARVGFRGI